MIVVARLEVMPDDVVPAQRTQTGNVNAALLDSPSVFGQVGTDQVYVDQLGRRARGDTVPGKSALANRVDAVCYDGMAEQQVAFGNGVRHSVSGRSDVLRSGRLHGLFYGVDAEIDGA